MIRENLHNTQVNKSSQLERLNAQEARVRLLLDTLRLNSVEWREQYKVLAAVRVARRLLEGEVA